VQREQAQALLVDVDVVAVDLVVALDRARGERAVGRGERRGRVADLASRPQPKRPVM
jgi:hypothetical protein